MQVTLSQCEQALEALKNLEHFLGKQAMSHDTLSNAIDVFAALITDAADSGALFDEEESDSPQVCADCAGSGEGRVEGSICEYCNGNGEW